MFLPWDHPNVGLAFSKWVVFKRKWSKHKEGLLVTPCATLTSFFPMVNSQFRMSLILVYFRYAMSGVFGWLIDSMVVILTIFFCVAFLEEEKSTLRFGMDSDLKILK